MVNQCYLSLNYYLIVMSVLKKVNNVRKYNNWLITLSKQILNFKYSKSSVIKLFWKVYKKYIFIVDMRMAASWISYGEIERINGGGVEGRVTLDEIAERAWTEHVFLGYNSNKHLTNRFHWSIFHQGGTRM